MFAVLHNVNLVSQLYPEEVSTMIFRRGKMSLNVVQPQH